MTQQQQADALLTTYQARRKFINVLSDDEITSLCVSLGYGELGQSGRRVLLTLWETNNTKAATAIQLAVLKVVL